MPSLPIYTDFFGLGKKETRDQAEIFTARSLRALEMTELTEKNKKA
jgi:hypothetical protein